MKTRKNYTYDNYETDMLVKRAMNGEAIEPYEWTRASRNWKFLKNYESFLKRFMVYINWEAVLFNYRAVTASADYKQIFDLIFNDTSVDDSLDRETIQKYDLPNYSWIDKTKSISYNRKKVRAFFCEYNLTEKMYERIMRDDNFLLDYDIREALITTKILCPDKRTVKMLKIMCRDGVQIDTLDYYQPKMLNTLICNFYREFTLHEIYKLLYKTHNLSPESKGVLRAWRRVLKERMEK